MRALGAALLRMERAAWTVAVGCVVALGALTMSAAQGRPASSAVRTSAPPMNASQDSTKHWLEALASRNPFVGSDDTASDARDDATEAEPAAVERPRESLPALRLVGIIGGPPWSAVIENWPGGAMGKVVLVGTEASGLRVSEIGDNLVRVVGRDTAWALRLRPEPTP